MDKIDIFQARFGQVKEFWWWYLEKIQKNSGKKFTSKEFQEYLYLRGLWLTLSPPYHDEMNDQVEDMWQTLQTIAYSRMMVYAQVSYDYIIFSLMCTTHHIFLVLPTKHFVNQYGEPTIPHNLETVVKPSVSNIWILFCLYVVKKATAHVNRNALNICHRSQRFFGVSLLGFYKTKKGTSYT